MPHLSRIWINPLRAASRPLLANPQVLHAAVLGGIPTQPVTERVLWRLDTSTTHRPELLVLTQSPPSWEHLIERYGWAHAEEPQAVTRDYQPLLDQLALGREFRFRLRANPISSTRNPASPTTAQKDRLDRDRPRGVRIAAQNATDQTTWLLDRLDRYGFEPVMVDDMPAVVVTGRQRLDFTKRATGGRRITIVTATYDGTIRVTDSSRASHSLLDGVGGARAYGCGLITLAPVHQAVTAAASSPGREGA